MGIKRYGEESGGGVGYVEVPKICDSVECVLIVFILLFKSLESLVNAHVLITVVTLIYQGTIKIDQML